MLSAFDNVQTACDAGSIGVLSKVHGVLLLMCQGVQSIIGSGSRDASLVTALSRNETALRCLPAVECERDDGM